jgi:hypothetical protein
VGAEGHQVDLQLGEVDVDLAGGLGRIDVEDDALLAADLADLGDRLDHADLVVHEHHRDHHGVGADGRLQHLEVDQAVFLDVEVGGLEAFPLEFAHGVEHGLVLGLDGDDACPCRSRCAAPLIARLLDSVAPEVQMISLGSALTSFATSSRASSTAFSAVQPKGWLRDAGLPNSSVR